MTRAELAKSILEREMSPEEFDQKVREVLADEDDMREVLELIAWFTRRYPTVEGRMAYVSRRMKADVPVLVADEHDD